MRKVKMEPAERNYGRVCLSMCPAGIRLACVAQKETVKEARGMPCRIVASYRRCRQNARESNVCLSVSQWAER